MPSLSPTAPGASKYPLAIIGPGGAWNGPAAGIGLATPNSRRPGDSPDGQPTDPAAVASSPLGSRVLVGTCEVAARSWSPEDPVDETRLRRCAPIGVRWNSRSTWNALDDVSRETPCRSAAWRPLLRPALLESLPAPRDNSSADNRTPAAAGRSDASGSGTADGPDATGRSVSPFEGGAHAVSADRSDDAAPGDVALSCRASSVRTGSVTALPWPGTGSRIDRWLPEPASSASTHVP